jgi:hypothetical protein
MRSWMIAEHITTIEKSMKKVERLTTEYPTNHYAFVSIGGVI